MYAIFYGFILIVVYRFGPVWEQLTYGGWFLLTTWACWFILPLAANMQSPSLGNLSSQQGNCLHMRTLLVESWSWKERPSTSRLEGWRRKRNKEHFDQISQVSENELSAGWFIVNCITACIPIPIWYTHIPIMASLEMKMMLVIIQCPILVHLFFSCFHLILFKFDKSSSWLTYCVGFE